MPIKVQRPKGIGEGCSNANWRPFCQRPSTGRVYIFHLKVQTSKKVKRRSWGLFLLKEYTFTLFKKDRRSCFSTSFQHRIKDFAFSAILNGFQKSFETLICCSYDCDELEIFSLAENSLFPSISMSVIMAVGL